MSDKNKQTSRMEQTAESVQNDSMAVLNALRALAAEEQTQPLSASFSEWSLPQAAQPAVGMPGGVSAGPLPDAETLGELVAPAVNRMIGRIAMGGRYTR